MTLNKLILCLIFLVSGTKSFSFISPCRVHGELTAEEVVNGNIAREGEDIRLTLRVTDPGIDQDQMWLKLTRKDRELWEEEKTVNFSYITPDRLDNITVRWTIPNVRVRDTGTFYVHVGNITIVACYQLHVGRAPAGQTDFYCYTYNFLNTSCFWHTGPDTNIPTNYTLYYGRRITPLKFFACVPPRDGEEEGVGGRQLRCDPLGMRDLPPNNIWNYESEFAFFVRAQNVLGNAATGNATHPYVFIHMNDALKTSVATDLTVPPVLTPDGVVTWGWPNINRVADFNQLIGEVTYTPLGCAAALVVKDRTNMTELEGGEVRRPGGVAPGLDYLVEVKVRSNLTFVWDRDVYWSDAVNRTTRAQDAAPTGTVPCKFQESAGNQKRAIPLEWEDVLCEERGSLATRFEVEIKGGAMASPHTREFAAGVKAFTFNDSWVIPNAQYWVRMRAVNDVGEGPWSHRQSITTNKETLDQPPRNVTTSDITPHGVFVTWQGSEHPYNTVEHYLVTVIHVETGEEVVRETPTSRRYRVKGLEGWSRYDVSVAECAVHCGRGFPPIRITTLIGAPSNVNVQLDTTVDADDQIGVTWNTPRPANGPVQSYQVEYYSDSGYVLETVPAHNRSWATTLDCDNMEDDEKVVLRVRAVNQNGTGQLLEGMWSTPVEKPVCPKSGVLSAGIIGLIAGLGVVILVIVITILVCCCQRTSRHLQKERAQVPSDFAPPPLHDAPHRLDGLPTPPENRVPSRDPDVEDGNMDLGYPNGVSVSDYPPGDQSDLGYPSGMSLTDETKALADVTTKTRTSYPELDLHGSSTLASDTSSGCSSGESSPPDTWTSLGENEKTRHVSTDSGVLNPQQFQLQAFRLQAPVPEIMTCEKGYGGALPEDHTSPTARQESSDSGLPSGTFLPPSPTFVETGEGQGELELPGYAGEEIYPELVVDKPAYGLLDVGDFSGQAGEVDDSSPADAGEGPGEYGLLDTKGCEELLPPPTVLEGEGYNYGLLEEDSSVPSSPVVDGGSGGGAAGGGPGYPSTSSDVMLLGGGEEEVQEVQVFDGYGALDVSRKPDPSLDTSVHIYNPADYGPSSDHDKLASSPVSRLPSDPTAPLLTSGDPPLTSSGTPAAIPPHSVESGVLPRAESGVLPRTDFVLISDVTTAGGCAAGIPGPSLVTRRTECVEPSEKKPAEKPFDCTKPPHPPRQNSFSFVSAGHAKAVTPLMTLMLGDGSCCPSEVSTRPAGFSAWGVSAGPKHVFPGDKEYVPDIPQHFLNPPDIHIQDLPVTPL